MNSKKIAALSMAAAMSLSFAACADNTVADNTVADNSAADSTAITEGIEDPVPAGETTVSLTPEEQTHRDMVERSFVQYGNTYRLNQKFTKALNGEKVTVAYLGGSITEGIGGTSDTCYAKLSFDALAERWGAEENMEYVNAGVSGTPSILGNLRVQKDVLDYNADIVFIEFAVNDGMETLYKESYESLVRTVLSQENEPAVILLFTVTKTGHTCQEHMKQIGEQYQLPMISVPDAIQPEIEAGRMTWADYSDDEAHPNAEGHKLVAEFISHYFDKLDARSFVDPSYEMPIVPKFGNPYENAFLAEADYDNSNENLQIGDTGSFSVEARRIADFEKGAWVYSGEGTEPLKMTVRGNSIFFVCKRNNSSTMGKFDVYINGEKAGSVDTNQSDGWGEPFAFQAIKWQTVRDMEVEIVPAEDSAGKIIEIFAIACTQNESLML